MNYRHSLLHSCWCIAFGCEFICLCSFQIDQTFFSSSPSALPFSGPFLFMAQQPEVRRRPSNCCSGSLALQQPSAAARSSRPTTAASPLRSSPAPAAADRRGPLVIPNPAPVAEPDSSSSPTARRTCRAHAFPGVARTLRRPLGLFKVPPPRSRSTKP
jgi:hypothetical protein